MPNVKRIGLAEFVQVLAQIIDLLNAGRLPQVHEAYYETGTLYYHASGVRSDQVQCAVNLRRTLVHFRPVSGDQLDISFHNTDNQSGLHLFLHRGEIMRTGTHLFTVHAADMRVALNFGETQPQRPN